jgi:general secretion pathway protein M
MDRWRARAQLESRVEHERTDLAWMRQTSGELQERARRERADRPTASVAVRARRRDGTRRGLATALKRVEPTGPRSVRASFEGANFDALIGWVDALARDYAVQTTDFSADRVETIGMVNARVVLEEP